MNVPVKYIVNVHINKVDENNELISETYEYEFAAAPLIASRQKAIGRAKVIINFFDNEMPEGALFTSFDEVQAIDLKGYDSFSVSIILIDEENDFDTIIFGLDEEDEMIDFLQNEASYYLKNDHDVAMTEVEVIKEDLDFILGK